MADLPRLKANLELWESIAARYRAGGFEPPPFVAGELEKARAAYEAVRGVRDPGPELHQEVTGNGR